MLVYLINSHFLAVQDWAAVLTRIDGFMSFSQTFFHSIILSSVFGPGLQINHVEIGKTYLDIFI